MKVAFLYPGQGVQQFGMGKKLYEEIDECKEIIDLADEQLDFDLKHMLFEEDELLNKTEYTQVCILVVSLCMWKALEIAGIEADITAGQSLGEYCALVNSGVLTIEEAVRIVRVRGKLMEHAVPAGVGTMSAIIGADNKEVEQICEQVSSESGKLVSVANYNCPGQCVISGVKGAVEKAEAVIKEKGIGKVVKLKVSGPFHTELYKEAGAQLHKELEKYTLRQPVIPYIANQNAEIITDSALIADLLEKQIYSPVLWEESMRKLIDMDVDLFVEVGPGKTLRGFLKKFNCSGELKSAEELMEEWL